MNLTLEQKAFYEYGKAVKDLSNVIKEIRNKAQKGFATEYRELPLPYRAWLLNYFGFETFVDEVRYRRAKCQLWIDVNFRNCENCKHYPVADRKMPCEECVGPYDITPFYWEPRKEEENETDT